MELGTSDARRPQVGGTFGLAHVPLSAGRRPRPRPVSAGCRAGNGYGGQLLLMLGAAEVVAVYIDAESMDAARAKVRL